MATHSLAGTSLLFSSLTVFGGFGGIFPRISKSSETRMCFEAQASFYMHYHLHIHKGEQYLLLWPSPKVLKSVPFMHKMQILIYFLYKNSALKQIKLFSLTSCSVESSL